MRAAIIALLLASFPTLLVAKETIELSCKSSKKAQVEDLYPGLKKLIGKEISVELGRTTVRLTPKGEKAMEGKSFGDLPTESYLVAGLGQQGKFVLASAGAFVGSETTTVYLRAKATKPGEKEPQTGQLTLKCKNGNAGRTAPFIQPCIEEPQIKKTVTCTSRVEERYGMPKTFTIVSVKDGLKVDYNQTDEDDADPEAKPDDADKISETFNFFANEDLAKNATIKLVEYCFFTAPQTSKHEFQLLRMSRKLAETGIGLASIPERASDGAASILYECK